MTCLGSSGAKLLLLCLYFPFSVYDSGEGIPDLLLLLVQWTQKTMVEKLTYSNEVQVCIPFPEFFIWLSPSR